MNFLQKTKSIITKGTNFLNPSDSIGKITSSLGDKFFGLLDKTFADRFSNKDNSKISKEEVQATINKYAKMNMAIAAASAAMPGPLGILSSAGEMVLITGNQMKMIYDLGCANDKESFLNKDLLLDIPLQAMGVSTNLDQMQDQLGALQESPVGMLQEKATSYAKVIAIKNLKKSLVKAIPVAGSLLMTIWTNKGTKKIAAITTDFMDDANVLKAIPVNDTAQEEEPVEVLIERIKVLATLMEQNGALKDEELTFLIPIIENAPIEAATKTHLLTEAKRIGSQFEIDYNAIRAHGDTADDLLSDMVVLAKRDGTVGPNELAYLKEVNRIFGEKEEDLMELVNA